MGLQIWPHEDVENILWATQTVGQAIITVSSDVETPFVYEQGFKQGFEKTLWQISLIFNDQSSSPMIWSREQILNVLQAARAIIQIPETALDKDLETDHSFEGFNKGFEVALWGVATAFGVSLFSVGVDILPEHSVGVRFQPNSWFQEDIQNILSAMKKMVPSVGISSERSTQVTTYREGFEEAMQLIAKSFGVSLISTDISIPKKNVSYWLRADIKRELYTLYQSVSVNSASFPANPERIVHWQGFKMALHCVAAAFGLKMPS